MSSINWKVALPLVLMFLIGGLNAIVPVLSPGLQAIAMAILPAVAAYFHVGEVQKAAGIK